MKRIARKFRNESGQVVNGNALWTIVAVLVIVVLVIWLLRNG